MKIQEYTLHQGVHHKTLKFIRYYHGTVKYISEVHCFWSLYYQINRIFMAICSRMDYFNDGPPSDRTSGEEGKITEEVRFCNLDRAVITGIIVVSYFAVRGIALQVTLIYTGCTRYPSWDHETRNDLSEEDRAIFKYSSTHLWKTVWSGERIDRRAFQESGIFCRRLWGSTCRWCCKGCDKRSVRACCYVICSLYVFTERGKLIAWYEKCIPGFVKHKINVFMKNPAES